MGSFSIWHWLIVLLVVMMVFGTKKLRNIGADLGNAIKGFKDGMRDGAEDKPPPRMTDQPPRGLHDASAIDVKARDPSEPR